MRSEEDLIGREIAGNVMLQEIFALLDTALGDASPGLPAIRAAITARIENFDQSNVPEDELEALARLKSGASARVEEVFTKIAPL